MAKAVHGYRSFVSSAVVGKAGALPAIRAVVEEGERARQFGFSAAELERAKKSMARFVESMYNERDKTESAVHVSEYTRNFLDGEAMPGIENEYSYHQDLLPYAYVTGDDAGREDSPLYGMFALVSDLDRAHLDGQPVAQHFIAQPQDTSAVAVKWDGEWQITYETFRDMGLAYSVGLLLIYLLVVGQFRSYVAPLIIMAPIPLTVIGVMPGHALLGAQFTATSMIGMIALAGIIVRNSILLIDFVNHALAAGSALGEAVIEAAAVRAKPIALTGVAAMVGGFFILDDPIFQGLAVSLIFGILVSTVLTLLVIPLLYYGWMRGRVPPVVQSRAVAKH